MGGTTRWGLIAKVAWPLVALAVFAGLQTWRIGVRDEILRDVRVGTPHVIDPGIVSELHTWVLRASLGETQYTRGVDAVRHVHEERPLVVAGNVAAACVVGVGGWWGGVLLAAVASKLVRLKYPISWRLRVRAAGTAMGMIGGWGLLVGAAAGAAGWWIGFDRTGTSRKMLDGLFPTWIQAGSMVVGWVGVMACLATGCFGEAVERAASSARCRLCGYSREGIASERCPECGTALAPGREHVNAAYQRRVGRRVVWLGVVAFAVGAAAVVAVVADSRVRRWVRLRPVESIADHVHIGSLRSGTELRWSSCIYGTVTINAAREVPSPTGPDRWIVRWRFESSSPELRGDASGTRELTFDFGENRRPAAVALHEFPFGSVSFVVVAANLDYLHLQAPGLIAR